MDLGPMLGHFLAFWILLALLTLQLSFGAALFSKLLPLQTSQDPFNWDEIEALSDLKTWVTCYEWFECAKLEVPLDWNNVTNPNKVILAISRLPAKVDRADASYGGPILINPGGPGGSGVDFLLWGGKEIQMNLDGGKHFDIVSWDPRAVLRTTPSSACFNSSLSRQLYNLKFNSMGTIDVSDEIFNRKWAAVHSFGKVCEDSPIGRYPDGSNIRQFSTTAMVAYDMVAIIDKLEEAKFTFQRDNIVSSPALLQYWGFSYGSMLGNTFASMFPGRIGRVLLDGVVDAEDYITTRWTQNLQDSMKTWASFSQFCYEGKKNCPLYDENSKSTQDIELKVGNFLAHLKENPMPAAYAGEAQIVSYSDVVAYIFQSLYFPWVRFPDLARVLADLISGDITSMAPLLSKITLDSITTFNLPSAQSNTSWDHPLPPDYPHEWEASWTILCSDGNSIQNRTKAEERAYMNILTIQSPIAEGPWLEITLMCIGWPNSLRSMERSRFTGPFGSRLKDLHPQGRPILWFSNTADPVTPLRNARKMAEAHEGSVVLVVDQPGHCNGPVNPSKCSYGVAREFFTKSLLPEEGTVCKGDFKPWQDGEMMYGVKGGNAYLEKVR